MAIHLYSQVHSREAGHGWTLQNWVGFLGRFFLMYISIYNHTLNVGDCIHEKWNSWNPSNKNGVCFFLKTIFLVISGEILR